MGLCPEISSSRWTGSLTADPCSRFASSSLIRIYRMLPRHSIPADRTHPYALRVERRSRCLCPAKRTPATDSPGGVAEAMTREQACLILGVKLHASREEIRSAHRRVMQTVHPDTNKTEEAQRLARMANAAREILDSPSREAPSDSRPHGEPPSAGAAGPDPAKRDFDVAWRLQNHATHVIKQHLDTTGSPLEMEEIGDLVLQSLEPGRVAPAARRILSVMVTSSWFLQQGSDNGYWTFDGITLRSVLHDLESEPRYASAEPRVPHKDSRGSGNEEDGPSFWPSSAALAFGWLCFLFVLADASMGLQGILVGLMIILGVTSYRSKRRRYLQLVPDDNRRRLWEIRGLVASTLCGLAVTLWGVDSSVLYRFGFTVWILAAYALAGVNAESVPRR